MSTLMIGGFVAIVVIGLVIYYYKKNQVASTPTMAPTFAPTMAPTFAPTMAPTFAPTMAPTMAPTFAPTMAPTMAPIRGCHSDINKISCPAGQNISGGTITYGRWDNTVCPHATVNSSTPVVKKNYPMPGSCIGVPSCDFSSGINNVVGDDPDPGVYKQYEISLLCK